MAVRRLKIEVDFDSSGAVVGLRKVDESIRKIERNTQQIAQTAKRGFQDMGESARKTNVILQSMHNQFKVLSRALVSMVGVLIAFNLLITLPQKIITGIGTALGFALRSLEEFQVNLIGLQGILATFVDFGTDAAKSFEMAGEAASKVIQELLKEAAKTPATFEQLFAGFMALSGAGGLEGLKNLREAVALNTILVNSVLPLTVGQDAMRQIATEIRAIFEGQARAGAVMARLLGVNTEEFKKQIAIAKEQGKLFEFLEGKLKGFQSASQKFFGTLAQVRTTLETMAGLLAREIIGPFASRLVDAGNKFNQILENSTGQLDGIIGLLSDISDRILQNILGTLKTISSDPVNAIEEGIIRVTVATLHWFNVFKNIGIILLVILKFINLILTNIKVELIDTTTDWGIALVKAAAKLPGIKSFVDEVSNGIKFWTDLVSPDSALGVGLKKTGDEISSFVDLWDAIGHDLEKQEKELERSLRLQMLGSQAVAAQKRLLEEINNDVLDKALKIRKEETEEIDKQTQKLLKQADILFRLRKFTIDPKDLLKRLGPDVFGDFLAEVRSTFREKPGELINIPSIVEPLEKAAQETARFVEMIAKKAQEAWDESFKKMLDPIKSFDKITGNLLEGVRNDLELLRLAAEGALPSTAIPEIIQRLGESSNRLRGRIGDTADAIVVLQAVLSDLKPVLGEDAEEVLKLEERIAQLQQRLLEIPGVIAAVVEATKKQALWTTKLHQITQRLGQDFELAAIKMITGAATISASLKELGQIALQTIGIQLGQGIANAIVAIVQGSESGLAALGKFVGAVLIQLGTLLITLGTVALLASAIGLFMPILAPLTGAGAGIPAALAAIAAGVAMVAAGALMSGGGGSRAGASAAGGGASGGAAPSATITSGLVNPQQGIAQSLSRLNDTLDRLEGIPPEQVLTTGFKNKGGIAKFVKSSDRREITQQTLKLATANSF